MTEGQTIKGDEPNNTCMVTKFGSSLTLEHTLNFTTSRFKNRRHEHQFRISNRMNHGTLKIVIQIANKAMASGH